jgi:hypothetical protein
VHAALSLGHVACALVTDRKLLSLDLAEMTYGSRARANGRRAACDLPASSRNEARVVVRASDHEDGAMLRSREAENEKLEPHSESECLVRLLTAERHELFG